MSISGISIPDSVIRKYEDKRFEKKAGGLILKLGEETLNVESEAQSHFKTMVDSLPDAEPRFILYDMPVKNRANLDDLRTVFIFWMPMESPVQLRMRYASIKTAITGAFRGIAASVQSDEKQELTTEFVTDRINRSQGINNP